MDFDPKIARIDQNLRKRSHLEPIRLLEAVRTVCENCEIYENPLKSQKILDQYPTKIIEKSCFEHVSVLLSKIM